VADINTVFTRETVRSFVFDPAKDLRIATPASAPQCGFNGVADARDRAVRVEVAARLQPRRPDHQHHLPAQGRDLEPQLGQPFTIRCACRAPSAPAAPESTEKDYLGRQLKTLLHELEHVFGAGAGEYYNGIAVTDTTGVAPIVDLALADLPTATGGRASTGASTRCWALCSSRAATLPPTASPRWR
jgi:hypothetical protein